MLDRTLLVPDLLHHVVSIPRIQPVHQRRHLFDMFVRVLERRQRRAAELPLARRAIAATTGPLGLALHLLPKEEQEQLLQRIGTQARGIVRVASFDECIAPQQLRDMRKCSRVDAVREQRLEQEQGLEGRVGGRLIHAPRSAASPAVEGAFASGDQVNRRHGL